MWMRGDGMEGNHGKRRQMDGAEKDRNRTGRHKAKLSYSTCTKHGMPPIFSGGSKKAKKTML